MPEAPALHTLAASSGAETARQQFVVKVVGASSNGPPVLEPFNVPNAQAGVPFTLDLDAYDPEGPR